MIKLKIGKQFRETLGKIKCQRNIKQHAIHHGIKLRISNSDVLNK